MEVVLSRDLEGILHLPDSATITALSGAEYGLKLGSQLFIKHIVESGLAAKGNSLQEGDLILKVWGPRGAGHSLGVSSAPLWRAPPCLVSLPGPSHGHAGGSSACAHSLPQPPSLSQGPAPCSQGWWHVLLAQWGHVHPTVPTGCGSPLCVHVPTE